MNLTNEEIIALREFIKWHYIPADNAVLTKLVRRVMDYIPPRPTIEELNELLNGKE